MMIVHTRCCLSAVCVAALLFAMSLTIGCVTPQQSARRADATGEPVPIVIDVDPASEISGVVRVVFEDSRGTIWLGGECDLFRYDGRTLTSSVIKDDLGRGVTIKRIVEDKDGNIWCGTTGGITRFDGTSFTSFGEKDGLISHDVWNLTVDPSGAIWICTLEGVCRFDGKTFTPFALPEAPPDPTRGVTSSRIVHCVMVDRKGQVWFGTNGGAYIYDGTTLRNLSERDGLPDNAVGGILEDRSGNIWFSTTHGGISRFDGTAFTNFTELGMIEGNEIWCLHEGRSGDIWIAGKRSPMYRYVRRNGGHEFITVPEQEEITTLTFTILEDSAGRVWLCGTNGLFRRDGESFVKVMKNGPWR